MQQYLKMLDHIMENGVDKEDRTGTGTRSVFGHQMRFDLNKGFPLVTTKKVYMKAVISELLWFLEGSTNERRLAEIHYGKDRSELDGKDTIWSEWANEDGELGLIYGYQWRNWSIPSFSSSERVGIDQIKSVIESIKYSPDSRRHIVSAWNVGEINDMNLPPCHILFQFWVADNKLSCQMYIRSWDVFLGGPFNIASYALLTMMIAQVTNLDLGDLVISSGDTHIYSNHFEQVKTQLNRKVHQLPTMKINPDIKHIDHFAMNDFELINYNTHPHIKGDVSV